MHFDGKHVARDTRIIERLAKIHNQVGLLLCTAPPPPTTPCLSQMEISNRKRRESVVA